MHLKIQIEIKSYCRISPKKESNKAIKNLKISPPVKRVLRNVVFLVIFPGKIDLRKLPGNGGLLKAFRKPFERRITKIQQKTTAKFNAIATYPIA